MTEKTKSIGILYVATGTEYITETMSSAASARHVMPGIPITLVTDQLSWFDAFFITPHIREAILPEYARRGYAGIIEGRRGK